jgi:hypothetical protein
MRKKKGKTYEWAPWCGVSSWSSFHPTRVAHEARAGGGVVPVVHQVLSPVVRWVLSPIIRRRSTHGLPHEQLLVRLGQVVHCCLSSIIVVLRPWCTCNPPNEQFLVSVGGGCSVIHGCRPRCRHSSSFIVIVRCHHPCSLSLSLFVVVVPVCCHCSLSSFVVVCHCCPCSSSSFVIVICHRRSSIHPHHSSSTIVLCCLSSIPSFHPQSTPQAVAREAGGGWRCRRRGWWQ